MKNTSTKYKNYIMSWLPKIYPSGKDYNEMLRYCYP